MGRKAAREVAMKIAFANLLGGSAEFADVLNDSESGYETTPEDMGFADDLTRGVTERKDDIDAALKCHMRNWELDRLPKLDLTILRIAMFELMCMEDTPKGAVINEAVRLAKKFCDDNAHAYINGILGAYVRGEGVPCEEGGETDKSDTKGDDDAHDCE